MKTFSLVLLPLLAGVLLTSARSAGVKSSIYLPCTNDTLPAPTEVEVDANVFIKVEIEASFPGGIQAWRDFLEKNLKGDTPVKGRRKAPLGTYTVVAQFIVDKEGKLSDFKTLTRHGYGMEEEVLRVLKKSPRWIPAEQGGRKVKAYRKQPVTFRVS